MARKEFDIGNRSSDIPIFKKDKSYFISYSLEELPQGKMIFGNILIKNMKEDWSIRNMEWYISKVMNGYACVLYFKKI